MSVFKSLEGRRPLVIAHRGASGTAPENTLAAFRMAVEVGADVLELDVRLTRDCQVVVCHDATIDRTTDWVGKLAEMDYDELRWKDAGYRFTMDGGYSFPFRGQGVFVPLLADVLRTFPGVPLIIELKERDPAIVPALVSVLRKHDRLAEVLVTSFEHQLLNQFRRQAPQCLTGCSRIENVRLLAAAHLRLRPLFGRKHGASFQLPVRKAHLPIVTPRVVQASHALGMGIYPYTVDDWKEMRRYLEMGVDGIITNYPHRLRVVVNNL